MGQALPSGLMPYTQGPNDHQSGRAIADGTCVSATNSTSASVTDVRPYSAEKRRGKKRQKTNVKELTQNDLQQLTEDALHLVFTWFPRLGLETYYLPPVHMNKIQHRTASFGGSEVKEIQKTAESDWRDDEVMQRTLHCLRALTNENKAPMVVLLQMQHDNYMNKPCYAAAARLLPRTSELPPKLKRGDFDLLFLHRRYGIIVAEIKSVGWRPGEVQDDATVGKKVKQALDQLQKAEVVLRHLVKDLHPAPKVTKTLILPNVSTARLRHLLLNDPPLLEEFTSCFNVNNVDEGLPLCLCSQQMTSLSRPADVTASILKELEGWWRKLEGFGGFEHQIGEDPEKADEVFQLMVARFCGPASTVQVYCNQAPRLEFRTLGDAVQEVGERMIQFALFPEQLAVLQEEAPCVYLTGPPGTGKTLLLVLVALKWAREGQEVHVVSTGTFSEAATHLLYYQVTETQKKTDPEAAGRVHLHLNGNSEQPLGAILTDLVEAASGGSRSDHEENVLKNNIPPSTSETPRPHQRKKQLYVVADEVGEKFLGFFEELSNNVSDLHIWAASYRQEHRPPAMTERVMSACLRSPPVVQRRMETAISFAPDASGVHRYEDRRGEYLGPTDGPEELKLDHADHLGWETTPAMDCVHCGHAIADLLHGQLHIKPHQNSEDVSASADRLQHPGATKLDLKRPAPLRYRDVIVIPDFYQDPGEGIRDGDRDPDLALDPGAGSAVDDSRSPNQPRSRAHGLVRGLRERGVPTLVVRHKRDREAIEALALAREDAVAVVAWGVSNGLERKVVVSVGQGRQTGDRVSGVLHGASRCVSQLVYVMCPESCVRG